MGNKARGYVVIGEIYRNLSRLITENMTEMVESENINVNRFIQTPGNVWFANFRIFQLFAKGSNWAGIPRKKIMGFD